MIGSEYAAGFFDGEGTIWIALSKTDGWRFRAVVSQNDVTPLKMLQARWGGWIKAEYRPQGIHWRWGLNRKQLVLQFLSDIRPFLIVKAEAADVMIEFISAVLPPEINGRRGMGIAERGRRIRLMKKLKAITARRGRAA